MMNKKLKNGIIVTALIAVVGVGGTLAYFSSVTNTKENTFTMGSGITGTVEEPSYDPNEALKFTPGKVIAKDPIVKNTSTDADSTAYVGAKITCKNAAGKEVSFAELDKFINVDFNTTDWTFNADKSLAYYTNILNPSTQTTPVFNQVEIDKLALTPEMVEKANNGDFQFDKTKYNEVDAAGTVISYTEYQMQNFTIEVTGYLVQAEGFTSPENALQTAFDKVFK